MNYLPPLPRSARRCINFWERTYQWVAADQTRQNFFHMLQPRCSLTTEIQEICPVQLSQLWVMALCNKSTAQKTTRGRKTCQSSSSVLRGISPAFSRKIQQGYSGSTSLPRERTVSVGVPLLCMRTKKQVIGYNVYDWICRSNDFESLRVNILLHIFWFRRYLTYYFINK